MTPEQKQELREAALAIRYGKRANFVTLRQVERLVEAALAVTDPDKNEEIVGNRELTRL